MAPDQIYTTGTSPPFDNLGQMRRKKKLYPVYGWSYVGIKPSSVDIFLLYNNQTVDIFLLYNNQAGTRRLYNVASTSVQRHRVEQTWGDFV